ncbi:Phosphotransferase enzyme family protein [Proteiniborus ethanoligenes]|uniref:Phosphotransferase enzyme family protein n=1 Tax=Proteiniborus ethanoligenes TaxID=415015 RepID=A0A1H3PY09_9FIRM|nr:aminoglycoside phosphotransferase family protein [Proteiniborus ethanoligenes]SDZ05966.1 Phosphotransferase enzyme family protein [Proteiniborus ethanoligenes]
MFIYSDDITEIIAKYIDCKYTVTEVGHHNLGRHLVYLIKDEKENSYILKIYGKAFRFCNELTGLKLLRDKIKCPKLLISGKVFSEIEWLLMSNIEGIILGNVWKELSNENKVYIMQQMGEILGRIHSAYKYDYYGAWQEYGTFILNHKDFMEYRKNSDKIIIENIIRQDIPHKELIMHSYEKLIKYYDDIKPRDVPRLCHHDFSARNMLINREKEGWKISGIIDFEHCYPDDPDIDFTDLYHTVFLEEPWLKEPFMKRYKEYLKIKEDVLEYKMKYYLLNKGLFICSWAYYTAPEYYLQGIKLLERLDDMQ